jgi:hypothetical protein
MDRKLFLSVIGAGAAWGFALPSVAASGGSLRVGAQVPQSELFAELPAAAQGLWVRYIMGFGTPYQKQIGFGLEQTPVAERYFIETQVGMPGGNCNPNSVRKAYLNAKRFGNLIQVYGVEAYVTRNGNLLLYDPGSPLMLLDSKHLYGAVPCTIQAFQADDADAPAHPARYSENAIVVPKSAVPATRCAGSFASGGLHDFEVWRSPQLPLGIAKIAARVEGLPPFEMRLDSYGRDFRTSISETLDGVKAMQNT